jgi:hypothetical protein
VNLTVTVSKVAEVLDGLSRKRVVCDCCS